jgi:hypothetical protein
VKTGKRRGDETGFVERGRHTFHRHEYEVLRAWVMMKIEQVQNSLRSINAQMGKGNDDVLAGQRDYFATILSYLNGVFRGGMKSCDPIVWSECWKHVTTVERHAGADTRAARTRTIPGVE